MRQILLILFLLTTHSSASVEISDPSSTLGFIGCSNKQISYFNINILPEIKKENIQLENSHCTDANFDGYKDILATHTPSGLIQSTDVYLFQKISNEYIKNNELSNLPCLNIDESRKIISGECFTSSMCERRTERYKFIDNKLEITQIEGSYCDPITGDTYNYTENYRNGKIIEEK